MSKYQAKLDKLNELLNRDLLGKTAGETKVAEEGVKTIPCPEAGQTSYGKQQQEELDKDSVGNNEQTNPDSIKDAAPAITDENSVSGTDGKTDTVGEKMKVKEKPESTSKIASSFAKGLMTHINKSAAAAQEQKKEAASQEQKKEVEYVTGVSMLNKKAALMNAKTAEEAEKAANDFYADLSALHANPMFQQVFQKHAALKMAEDVKAAMEEGAPEGSEEAIAAALQQAVNEDPELAAELEGEITGDAIDDLAAAEQQAAVIDQIAEATGNTPEDVIAAAQLIEDAAAENNMSVDEFVEVIDAAMQQGESAPEAAPVEEGADVAKEASFRRLRKAANYVR